MKKILTWLAMVLVAVSAYAQGQTIRGTVLSKSDGEPLIGATVIPVSNPSAGTATDIDGNFTVKAAEGEELQFSYIGYTTVKLAARQSMTVEMSEDSALLDEVVVVGYQTVRKADLTGAVSVMNMNEPLSENSGNIMNSMSGKLPGVTVVPSAEPGANGYIRVRGMSTANSSNDPLYIIDGVPTDNINCINPSDIETMQVLKDAASASIYGSRAANGVVIITTKHGKGDRLTVNVNYALSAQTVAKKLKLLNAQQWADCYWQAALNSGYNPATTAVGTALFGYNATSPVYLDCIGGDALIPVANTDWQDEIYQTAWANNLTATVSNNTEKGAALFSMNYINQDGNLKTSFYRRFSARLNSRYDINKWVSVGENLVVANWRNRGADVYGGRGIPMLAMQANPALPVYAEDGSYVIPAIIGTDKQNPVQLQNNAADNTSQNWRILGNAYVEVRPVEGLTLKSNIGIEHSQFFNKTLTRTVRVGDVTSVESKYGQGDTWTWTNTANYNKTFNDVHHLTALIGTEAINYTFEDVYGKRNKYMFEDTDFMQVGAGTGDQYGGGGKNQWAVFSLFGKVDYNFADRYLVSFTIRRDQNSRFHKDHRTGVFPAASVAWRPSAEPFWPENNVVNDLKVRYSWGQNGNANIPSIYPAFTTYEYSTGNAAYDIAGTNSTTTSGIKRAASGNPDLKWETTTQNNIGVDLQLFSGKVNLTADWYYKHTTDMLTIPPALDVAGENAAIWLNTGEMRNTGWEVTLAYNSPMYGDFSWNGSINLSQYKNKLQLLNNQQKFIGGDWRLVPGQPMGILYGYVCDGIFQTTEQVANHAYQNGAAPGRLMYRDLDGNGVINDADRCFIGDPNPDLGMGVNLAFRYKHLTLDMFFAGEFGYDIVNSTKRMLTLFASEGGNYTINRGVDILDAWTPTNTDTDIPALSIFDNNNEERFSTYFVDNGSYLKMKYVKLSYNFPQRLANAIGSQNIDVFGQVENVFTLTDFKGLDPELLPGEYGVRVADGGWVRPRTFTVGVNITF